MEEGKNNSNKGMMFVIMGMLGLIIIALVGVSFFLISSMGGLGGITTAEASEPEVPSVLEQRMFDLSTTITTNLHDSPNGGQHLIRMERVSLGINNTDPAEATTFIESLSTREAAAVDSINTVLRRTTADELNMPGGDDMLRENLLQALQARFGSLMIVDVYFQMFVTP